MRKLLQPLDQLLNRFTMYKVVLFGLFGLWLGAELMALTGLIGVSAWGIALSLSVLVIVCWATTAALAAYFKAPYNNDSYFISALILTFILPPIDSVDRLVWVALCGFIAMASKYLLTWRGSHIFNPVAFGAVVLSIAGVLPAAWWVATPNLLPLTAVLALIVLRKQRNFQLFATFAVVALLVLLLNDTVLGDQTALEVFKSAALSWPIVFMGSIMLTEPLTLPAGRQNQLLVAALVGAIFAAQINVGPVSTTPQFALVMGNVFALLLYVPYGANLRLKRMQTIAPDTLELVFDKPKNLHFRPGQYLEMTLARPYLAMRGNRRTFSIASAPHETEVRLGIRVYTPSSKYKSYLQTLQPGALVRSANVKGSFTLPADTTQPLLFIAGGIGITPFRSMVAELLLTNQSRDIRILYTASTPEHFAYKSVLDKAATVGVKTDYIVTGFDGEELQTRVPDLAKRAIYISGPDGMVRHYDHMIQDLGVSRRHIHKDHFSGY